MKLIATYAISRWKGDEPICNIVGFPIFQAQKLLKTDWPSINVDAFEYSVNDSTLPHCVEVKVWAKSKNNQFK